jgi:phosphate/sulfate permease
MAWSIGANDVANAMGTSVGSGGLTLRKALIVAAIMEFCGSVFVGSHVSETVRSGMFDPTKYEALPLTLGFISALLSAAIWLQIATYYGWPVSSTHSIVGSVVGVGILIGGFYSIRWEKILAIVLSWVISPLGGGLIAFLLLKAIHKLIINDKHPLRQLYKFIPYIMFYVVSVLCLAMVYKGLPKFKLDLPLSKALVVSSIAGIVAAGLSILWTKKLKAQHDRERVEKNIELDEPLNEGIPFVRKQLRGMPDVKPELRPPLAPGSEIPAKRWEIRRQFEFEKIESVFSKMMIASACFLAFSHGANDVANAVGPMAAALDLIKSGIAGLKAQIPVWILVLGATGIVVGLATWGYKVIETIGTKITHLTPSRGFAANIAAATTIVLASRLGMPISTTHTLVGAVMGIGLARGIDYLNLRVIRNIVISWLITVPVGAILAILFYEILKFIFIS